MPLPENPGQRASAVVAGVDPVRRGQAVATAAGATLGHQMAPAPVDGQAIDGVALTDAEPGRVFTFVLGGWVACLAADGVALAVDDPITPAPGGAFRLAAAGDWVAGKAKQPTTGGVAEPFVAHLFPPGYRL